MHGEIIQVVGVAKVRKDTWCGSSDETGAGMGSAGSGMDAFVQRSRTSIAAGGCMGYIGIGQDVLLEIGGGIGPWMFFFTDRDW